MRIKNSTQRFEEFVRELQESFWGDFQGRTRETLQRLLETDSEEQMAEYLGLKWHERAAGEAGRIDYRNGFYEREYVTPLGVIRFRVSRTRLRSFLPRGMRALQRRSPEVSEMIRQAFLRGISTRGVGRVVSLLTGEAVSAQTVSRLTRVLDEQVEKFHHAPLGDDWCYLLLDGVWLKVRRAFGPQKVLLLVAYGVRTDGRRQLLAFVRAKSESPTATSGLALPGDINHSATLPRRLAFYGRLCGAGCSNPGRVSASAAPALLGAQDAQSVRGGAPCRPRRSEARCATHLSSRQPRGRSQSVPAISISLAGQIFQVGETPGTRSARTADVFRISTAPVAEAAHHQCDREMFCRSTAEDTADGRIHQCRERGSNHLCDFQSVQ